ncbi:Cytochrome P450 4g15 [Carabus blaptoides fortunei]
MEIVGDPDTPLTYKDIQKMFYLERVIKEVLRLYPPVPFFVRNVTEDLPIGEHTLPRGAACVISPFVLHRNPDVWPDPEKFNPDRFLRESIENRHPYSYIPFSGGSRNCIGNTTRISCYFM